MIILIHGVDTYRSQLKLAEFKNKFIKDVDPSKLNYTKLEGVTLNLDIFSKAIKAAPFMAKKRMIVVNNFLKSKNKNKTLPADILEMLKKHNPERNIIIFYEENKFDKKDRTKKKETLISWLLKQKYVYDYQMLNGQDLIRWLQEIADEKDVTISAQAANTLIQAVMDDTWAMYQEMSKLAAYAKGQNKTEISVDDVSKMVVSQSSNSIFSLVDNIGTRQKSRALKILNELLDSGMNELYVLTMITRQFRIILIIKDGQNRGQSMSTLSRSSGLSSYVLQKCSGQAVNFNLPQLQQIYNALLEMDHRLKSSRDNFRTLFDLLIFSM